MIKKFFLISILIYNLFTNLSKYITQLYTNGIFININSKMFKNHIKKYEDISNSFFIYVFWPFIILFGYLYGK